MIITAKHTFEANNTFDSVRGFIASLWRYFSRRDVQIHVSSSRDFVGILLGTLEATSIRFTYLLAAHADVRNISLSK